MIFRINKIPFLQFFWKFEKELHNKLGKPNQKTGCDFETANIYEYKIQKEFKEILTLKSEVKEGKADILKYISDKNIFKSCLPKLQFSGQKKKEKAQVKTEMLLQFNGKKLFKKLYSGKTIDIFFMDVATIDKLATLPEGDITFNIKFIDPSLAPQAIPLIPTILPNADGLSFTIKTDESILDLPIDTSIDHIECDNLYKIDRIEDDTYKIDVENYKWLLGKCDYKQTKDEVNYKFNAKLEWKTFKKDLNFKLNSKKDFEYTIIKNASLDNPLDKNPLKECSSPKEHNGEAFLLSEEANGENVKILGKYKGD